MILEALKKTFLPKKNKTTPSTTASPHDIQNNIPSKDDEITIGFKDDGDYTNNYGYIYDRKFDFLVRQKKLIEEYRRVSERPDVDDAIDSIINEAIFVEQREQIIKLDIDEENEKIKKTFQSTFDEILNIFDLDNNIYNLLRRLYIDGQLNIHVIYNNNNINDGIKHAEILSPFYFYYDEDNEKWKYLHTQESKKLFTNYEKYDHVFDKEEIIHIDSGIYDYENKLIKGWLDIAIKPSNQLNTLEDLLIPMRFSRSVSRRVFNVDVADLPPVKAKKYLEETKNRFKYKKHYNPNTGEVSNNQHIISMVEDYWFANRNGGKGTTVDVLDETGNLGELNDIIYFQKKIYRALKVPTNRILNSDDKGVFGPNEEEISHEDMKFYLNVLRFRKRFLKLIEYTFKRQILAKNIITPDEYEEYSRKIKFYFTNENKFFIKIKQIEMQNTQDLYTSIKEDIGTVYSYTDVFKKVFNKNDDEIKELLTQIQNEKKDKLMSLLYQSDEENY